MSREQEFDFLKKQAEAMRAELKNIEARIKELAKEAK
jgi:archaellum component FlaC